MKSSLNQELKTIKIKDKYFSLFIDEAAIHQGVKSIADKITNDLKDKDPLFLPVLNGSFMFAVDLLKEINFVCEISFVKLSSYDGTNSTKNVKELIGLAADVKGRTVVIIEDIIDTGLSIERLIEILKEKEVENIRIATLLFKPESFKKNYKIDYIGMNIKNDFVVGYGMDYNGYGRNLNEIYKIY